MAAPRFALALIRRASRIRFYSREIRRQLLAAWMLAEFLGRAMHLRVLALRLLDHFTDDRLKLEPLHCACGSFFRLLHTSRSAAAAVAVPAHESAAPPTVARFLSCAMSSRWAGAEEMGGPLTMGD